MINGATISSTPRGSVQGGNAAVSPVSHDLKHISLHLILQNQSLNVFCLQIPAPKTRETVQDLYFQEFLRTKKSLEGGEARFVLAFQKCSKSEGTRMVKGNLFIRSCSQLITWPHLDNVLKVTSSQNKRSFKNHESYFSQRHSEEKGVKLFPGATLWMPRKWMWENYPKDKLFWNSKWNAALNEKKAQRCMNISQNS